ncbi:MAG TPA: DUF5666 domain-containing protein [Candidatus Koribacter sp.]|jgi:hypothetical protein
MIRQVLLSVSFLAAVSLFAQQGTPPDPMAGQSAAQPGGAPTNTPQAQQDASPAAKPQPAQQNNAATEPAEAKPAAEQPTQPANNGAAEQNSNQNAPPEKQNPKPQTDNPPTTASNVELTPPVTGAPETKIIDPSAVGKHAGMTGASDPLMDVPPLPKGQPTLIGGVATKVDRIRSRVTVEPYGAKKKMTVMLDERTHIYRNGVETTIEHIKKGDRVYFDTMLDGPKVFAKNVRVMSETGAAEVRGQITSYDYGRGLITLQDALSSRPVTFRIANTTKIQGQGSASANDLARGALVDVLFAPDKANRGIATQIMVLARPGVSYTFAGTITNVNVRDGIVSVENQTDGKVYDIEFDTRSRSERSGLHVGNDVNISATFDGENYRATNVTVTEAAKSAPKSRSAQPKIDEKDQ